MLIWMSRQVGGGRWTASGVDSRCGRVDSFGRARSARRKFSTRMRSCRTCVQTLMIMSGQLGPGRVDSGRCHEWTVRQLLQVGGWALCAMPRLRRQALSAIRVAIRLIVRILDPSREFHAARLASGNQPTRGMCPLFNTAYPSLVPCWGKAHTNPRTRVPPVGWRIDSCQI